MRGGPRSHEPGLGSTCVVLYWAGRNSKMEIKIKYQIMYQTHIEVALDDVRKINVGKFCVLGNTFCTARAADQAMRQVDPLIWIGSYLVPSLDSTMRVLPPLDLTCRNILELLSATSHECQPLWLPRVSRIHDPKSY